MNKHPGWRESLRTWWRWHMERNQVHVYGVHELRRIGTVVESKGNYWRIDDSVGRACYVAKSLATD